MNRYEQLTKDLQEATEKARAIAMTTDDGGTCNFDSCIIFLPRWNNEKTIAAIKAAGVGGFRSNHYGKVCYIIGNPVSAQGNANTAQAETIRDVMRSKEYQTAMYYQMD